MNLERGFAGLMVGVGKGLVEDAASQREENLRRLEMKFRTEEAGKDREFRAAEGELDRGFRANESEQDRAQRLELAQMSEAGANARAGASREPRSKFTSYQTGADGQLYGITRDGTAEPVMAGDAPFQPAKTPTGGGERARVYAEALKSLEDNYDMTPEDKIDFANRAAAAYVSGSSVKPPAEAVNPDEAIEAAKDAIARGADPEKVKARLKELGIDAGDL